MEHLRNKVAVITGGASGIGRAYADRAREERMRIVVADVREDLLETAVRELKDAGADAIAVRADVATARDVDALAARALEAFGAVHVLFNNAGVALRGPVWQHTIEQWEWILGVNLRGVIHGIRTFVPLLLAQQTPAHIVNTASVAGLCCTSGLGAYNATKHAVVALSETLALDLALQVAPIRVSVVCPGWVKSGMSQEGTAADAVADRVFDAIRAETFYVLTHPEWNAFIQRRTDNILTGRGPALL